MAVIETLTTQYGTCVSVIGKYGTFFLAAPERRRRKCGRNIRIRTGLKKFEVDPIQ